jgi:electron transport complex protein RnfE
MKKYFNELTKGILRENPLLILVLGTCPSMAITTTVENGIGMGIAATFVLVCSNIVISMLRNIIPKEVRIPAFIVVIAAFVTITDLVLHAYAYDLWKSLGLFIPLIVVNCIILGRAEAFASLNPVFASALDGIGMGIGFTLALIVISSIREILGNGTFLGMKVFGDSFDPAVVMVLPPGGFFTLGFIVAAVTAINKKMKARSNNG